MTQQRLLFVLRNNTSGTIPVNFLRSGSATNIANATTRYQWDVTGQTYTQQVFSIQYKFSSSFPFETFSGSIGASNINALLAALNGLNIGVFWQETVGLNTYVVTYNDTVIYGNLVIDTATPATSTVFWDNYTVIAGGNLQIDVNAVNVVNNNNPGVSSGNIPALVSGDAIDVNVQASPGEATDFSILRTLAYAPFTSNNLYIATVPGGGSDSHSFTIDTNYVYLVTWGTAP